jgi:hypothetical protein
MMNSVVDKSAVVTTLTEAGASELMSSAADCGLLLPVHVMFGSARTAIAYSQIMARA